MHYLEFEVKKNVAFCMFLLNKKKHEDFTFQIYMKK